MFSISRTYLPLLLGLAALLATATGCSDHDADDATLSAVADSLYVTVSIDAMPAARTRSNPTGGEEGDGSLTAIDREYAISDLNIFKVDGDAVECRYLNAIGEGADNSTAHTEKTVREYTVKYRRSTAPVSTTHFLAVANMGRSLQNITTLSALYAAIPDRAWTGTTVATASCFVMGSEQASTVEGGTGTEADPLNVHIDLERLAARIDILNDGAASSVAGDWQYVLKEGSTLLATLHVNHVRIVNACQQPSFLLKRVSPTIGGTPDYLADETTSPANYVIDPRSAQRIVPAVDEATLTTWYGDSRLTAATVPDGFAVEADSYTLCYTNENTMVATSQLPQYMTGLLLGCTYVPATVYSDADATIAASYTPGQNFWRVELLTKEKDEAHCRYFDNEVAAMAYAANPTHSGIVTQYTAGRCYYYVWIRHANSSATGKVDGTLGTMEYAIVRNNVYRVAFNSFTGPGTPTPTAQEAESLRSRIYVRKWREVAHPDIYI